MTNSLADIVVKAVADAIDEAAPSHHIKLIGLADNVATYRATVGDGEPREFVGVDAYNQASDYVDELTRTARAEAAIAAYNRTDPLATLVLEAREALKGAVGAREAWIKSTTEEGDKAASQWMARAHDAARATLAKLESL